MLKAIIILIILIVATFSKPIGSIVNLLWRILGILLVISAAINIWQAIAERKTMTNGELVKEIIKNILLLIVGLAIFKVRLV